MADRIANDKKGSALHRMLGAAPATIRQELASLGIDPAAEISAMRRLGRTAAACFAPQIRQEAADQRALERDREERYPMYEEAACAGSPSWDGQADPPTETSIFDILGHFDPKTAAWVRVSGWSMRDEGIKDGDMVLVDTKREAKSGDIVVAHIAGEGQVVKRILMKEGGAPAVLESANPDFPPRIVDAAILRIHGVVVGRAGKL